MVMVPGFEWNGRSTYMANRSLTYQHHIGVYALDLTLLHRAMEIRALEGLVTAMPREAALLVANHPNWLLPEHFDEYTLFRLAPHLDGLEIYNAMLEWDEGEADATGRWDRLLAQGAPLLGFASDDSHALADVGKAWITAKAQSRSLESIFRAIKAGNFYCSTGVSIQDVGRDGDEIFIVLPEECRIRVIGWGGRLQAEHVGSQFTWRFNGRVEHGPEYARFHVTNRNWEQAWTQPFFRCFQPGADIGA